MNMFIWLQFMIEKLLNQKWYTTFYIPFRVFGNWQNKNTIYAPVKKRSECNSYKKKLLPWKVVVGQNQEREREREREHMWRISTCGFPMIQYAVYEHKKTIDFFCRFFPNFMPQDDRDTTRNTQQDNKITKPFSVQPNSTNHMLWIWWFIYNFVVVDNHITAALSYVWKKIGRKTCVRKSIQKSFNIVVVAPFTRVFLVCNWRTLLNVNYFWSIDCNRPRNLFPFHLSIESFHSKRVIYFTPLTKEHEKKKLSKVFFR